MTDSLIERVAKAIDARVVASKKAVAAKSGEIRAILDAVPWERQSESYRDECRHLAHSAIEAMREPTPDVVKAWYACKSDGCLDLYHAMIDEALK